MATRCCQSEAGRSAAVGGLCVYVVAGVQQHLRDLDDVLRRPLPKILDTVRGDTMQECGTMLARRTLPREVWVITQQLLERRCVAADDYVGCRFEVCDRRVV